jgi:hypothetical protein
MAKLAPEIQDIQSSNYGNRGPGPVDTSVQTLFEGLGDALQNFTSMEDQLIKDDISLTAHDEVEAVAQQSLQQVGTGAQIPEEIKRSGESLERLKSAYENGAFSDLYFTSKLMSTSKRLKSQYPGYRDAIDGVIGSAAGSSLANQMRRELNAELKAQAAAEDEEEKFWRNWSKQEAPGLTRLYGTSDLSAIASDRGMSRQQVMDTVSRDSAYREDLEFQKNTVQPMQKDKIKRLASTDAVNFITDNFRIITYNSGKPGNLSQAVEEVYADGQVTSDEMSYMETTVIPALNQARTELQQLMLQPINQNGDSYSSLLRSETDRSDALAAATAYIDSIERAITDENVGMLKFHARQADARVDKQKMALINGPSGDIMLGAKVLQDMGFSPEMLQGIDVLDYEDAVRGAVIDAMKIRNFRGEKGLGESFKDMQKLGVEDAQVYNTYVDQMTRAIVDPSTPQQVVKDTVESVFGEENYRLTSMFTPSSRVSMYQKLTAKPVVDKVMSFGKRSPESRKLREWSFEQFSLIARPYAKTMVQAPEGRHNIEWNNESGQFDIEYTEGFKDAISGYVGTNAVDTTTDAIQKLNDYLVNLRYIAGQTDSNYNEIVRNLFAGLEVDKTSPIWGRLVEEAGKEPLKEEDKE